MKQILLWSGLLAIGAGAFVALILSRGLVDPVLLRIGFDAGGGMVLNAIKVVGAVLLGVPIAALFWSNAAFGSDLPRRDVHGYTLLRLRSGARYFFSVMSVALAVLFFLVSVDEPIAFQFFMISFGTVFLFAGWWIFSAKVRFDEASLFAMAYSGATHSHDWADLTKIVINREAQEYHLLFRSGRKARISFYYQGVDQLISLARRKLDDNHA